MEIGNRILIYPLVILGLVIILTNSCKKSDDNHNTVSDIDGNIYHTVIIGTQVWMVENLKTTKYRNGEPISNVTDSIVWANLLNGAYCNYNNDANNSITYGRLYNWFALNDSRSIAPVGWHVPTDPEWKIMETYMGGKEVSYGGKLKESGTTHWPSPNIGATNETGFTALPGGNRSYMGFSKIGSEAIWWTSTDYSWASAIVHTLYPYNAYFSYHIVIYGLVKQDGASVRCIKD